jgi:hypothetical protein
MIDYKRKTRQELEDEANAISWETHYHQVILRLEQEEILPLHIM